MGSALRAYGFKEKAHAAPADHAGRGRVLASEPEVHEFGAAGLCHFHAPFYGLALQKASANGACDKAFLVNQHAGARMPRCRGKLLYNGDQGKVLLLLKFLANTLYYGHGNTLLKDGA